MASETYTYEDGLLLGPWIDTHKPPKNMVCRDSFFGQTDFIRDKIYPLIIGYSEKLFKKFPIKVVGTLGSKSITIPIYGIKIPGLELRLRGDFDNWIVSIKSDKPIKDDFHGLIKKDEKVHPVYMEGIAKDWMFGSYNHNPKEFSAEIHNEFQLYAFFLIVMDNLKNS